MTAKPAAVLADEKHFDALLEALRKHARGVLEGLTTTMSCKGYIIAKLRPDAAPGGGTEHGQDSKKLLYEDFHPFLPRQFEEDPGYRIVTLDNYNRVRFLGNVFEVGSYSLPS